MFDIEASNLSANFGVLLTACFKELGTRKIISFSKKNESSDFFLTRQIINELNNYDIIVTWFGRYYDVPFLRTRQMINQIPFFIDPRIKHLDLWFVTKQFLKFTNNRLDTVSTDLGFAEKTRINGEIWTKALAGNKKALKYILDHNKKDVLVLEKVYNTYQKNGILRQIGSFPKI